MAEIKVKDLSRYKKGKVYSIRSHNCPEYYVGSTCLSLADRLRSHCDGYKIYLKNNTSRFTKSYDILEKGDYYIELLEEYPCNSKAELERREGHYIREAKELAVNVRIAGRTRKEFSVDNGEKIAAYSRAYRAENPEAGLAYQNEYRAKNREAVNENQRRYRAENIEKTEQYQEENAEKIAEKARIYRSENKEAIAETKRAYR